MTDNSASKTFPPDAQASLAVNRAGEVLHQTANLLAFDELPLHVEQEDIILTLDPATRCSGRPSGPGAGSVATSVIPDNFSDKLHDDLDE